MKIIEINMPSDVEARDGLANIQMKRLGPTVVLAGKNGSGKTRLLRRIFNWVRSPEARTELHLVEATMQTIRTQISTVESALQLGAAQIDTHLREHHQSRLNLLRQQLQTNEAIVAKKSLVSLSEAHPPPDIVYFVPKATSLLDSGDMTPNALKKHTEELFTGVGMDKLQTGSFATVQRIQNQWWEATHQHSQLTEAEKTDAIDSYKALNDLFENFLGQRITRAKDGQAELFGFPIGKAKLSSGQTIIVQFCMAIYAQAKKLSNLIVLMDEPENYLHPSIMLDVISAVQKHLSGGQLWIATHSIPVLAHLDPSAIWWMEKGKVSYAGNIPRKVLEGLLGDEERINKLSDFLNLPFEFAASRYAAQSLFQPDVALTGRDDPQAEQLIAALKKFPQGKKVRILDFGAGKGRLASAVFDAFDKDSVRNWFDYVAFDLSSTHKIECENAIARIYGDAGGRYFNDFAPLMAKFDKDTFDAVVMCNVLHEIDPKDWLSLFSQDEAIMQLLKQDGFLLLIEDNQLPIGEKAHQKGFLVLDTPQVKTLFCITEGDYGFIVDAQREGRLKAHQIPRKYIIRCTDKSRATAVKEVFFAAKNQIKSLRNKESSYQNGRLHGFWVQQFANARLVLDELVAQ